MNTPLLIVVTGCPASGKTTLAHLLAKRIGCPTICRDEIKEGFVNTMRSNHAALGTEINQQIYGTFLEILDFLLSKQITLVAEAAFQHPRWASLLEPLSQKAHIKIIVCTVDPNLARSRFVQRSLSDPNRSRFHGDDEIDADIEGLLDNYHPPLLPIPTLEVDTSDGYRPDLDDIESFLLKC